MSAAVTTRATTGTDRPGVVPAARTGDVDGPSGRDRAPGDTGTPLLSWVVVVLVSVVLSVTASVSVVASTDVGADADRPAPAAVEDGAGTALENYGYTREGAFCPTSSSPPAAC